MRDTARGTAGRLATILRQNRAWIVLIVLYTAGTLLFLAPAFDASPDRLPAPEGHISDVFQYTFYVHYMAEALTGPKPVIPITDTCRPTGIHLGQHNPVLTFTVPGGLLTLLPGITAVQAFKILLVAAVIATLLATVLLVRRFTGDMVAAAAAAPLLVLFPVHIDNLIHGHPKIVMMMWLPLIFLYTERLITDPSIRTGAVLGILNVLQFLTSPQITAYLSIGIPLYAAGRYLQVAGPRIDRDRLTAGLVAIAIFLCITVPLYLGFRGGTIPLDVLEAYTLRLADPGMIVVFAIAAGIVLHREAPSLRPLYITGLVAVAFAAGLSWEPAPYRALYHLAPYFQAFKTTREFLYLFVVTVTVLAGWSIHALRTGTGSTVSRLAMVVLLIAAAGYILPGAMDQRELMGTIDTPDSAVYDRIAADEREFTVATYPMKYLQVHDYAITRHGTPQVNCQVSFQQEENRRFADACGSMVFRPTPQCMDAVDRSGVRYVIVDERFYDGHFDPPGDGACTGEYGPIASRIGGEDAADTVSGCCTGDGQWMCLADGFAGLYADHPAIERVMRDGDLVLYRVDPGQE